MGGLVTRKKKTYLWWEDLKIPVRWLIVFFEALWRKETKTRSLVAGRENAHITFDELFTAWTTLWYTLTPCLDISR